MKSASDNHHPVRLAAFFGTDQVNRGRLPGLISGLFLGIFLWAQPLLAATYLDQFDSQAYNNSDGTTDWSGNSWIETGDDGNPASGDIMITGGSLRVQAASNIITRQADLTTATSATLSFDFTNNISGGGENLYVEIYNNGTSNWDTLATHNKNSAASGSFSQDITSYIASNTQIRFRSNNKAGVQVLFDNVQISYVTPVPHFAISHDGNGDTCNPEAVTISRHDSSHVIDTTYTGTITLSTSTANGDWSVYTGSGTLVNSGNGNATYTYAAADNGQVVLALSNTTAETLNINISDGTYSEDATEDNDLTFTDPGPCAHFNIIHDGAADTCTPEQIKFERNDFSHNLDTTYTGTVTLSTSTARGNWTVYSAAGTLDNGTLNDGAATYNFTLADAGDIILELANTTAETLNINITDGIYSEDPADDPDLTFTSGFPTTFRDEFSDNTSYSSNDGSANWSGAWQETNDDGNPNSGQISMINDVGTYQLSIQGNNTVLSIEREANLLGASSATLTFTYRRNNIDKVNEAVSIQASNNGGTGWTEIDTIGRGNDTVYQSASYDFTAYIASNTRIRFEVPTAFDANDQIFFDDVQILKNSPLACGGVDHYAITTPDGTGITCLAEEVTITGHDATHTATDPGNTTIDLTTSTNRGGWSDVVAGTGALSSPPANDDGTASYIFPGGESSVTLSFNYTNPATDPETVNFNITSSPGEDAAEDASISFSKAGFVFVNDTGTNNYTITTQIAGKDSPAAPNDIALRAVKASDLDPSVCLAAFPNNYTPSIDLGAECLDPAACAGNQVSMTNNSVTTAVSTNDDDSGIGTSAYTSKNLLFQNNATNTEAALVINYPDAGRIQLHARYDIPLENGAASGKYMIGSSNTFVVRPFALQVTATGNPGAGGPGGATYVRAGAGFTANVRAVLWETADDDGNPSGVANDGIADGHSDDDPSNNADLSDNAAAPNFGQESTTENVTLAANLNQPGGGANPGLAGTTTVTSFTTGSGSSTVRYDEVGIIELNASIADNDYLGIGAAETAEITARSGYVGRFFPDHFDVSISPDPPVLADACASGGFTYLSRTFHFSASPQISITAKGAGDLTTTNYDCPSFYKLAGSFSLDYTDTTALTTLSPTVGVISPAAGDTTNCSGGISLTLNESFRYWRPADETTPYTPFAAGIDLSLPQAQLTDSDSVCYTTGSGCQDFTRNGITGANLRHGIAMGENAFGPQDEPLLLHVHMFYYKDATDGWLVNSADDCTDYTYSKDSENDITVSISPVGSVTVTAGAGHLSLSPVTDPDGDGGTVDLSFDFPGWLEPDHSAEAFFGIYRGNDRVINWQEISR